MISESDALAVFECMEDQITSLLTLLEERERELRLCKEEIKKLKGK